MVRIDCDHYRGDRPCDPHERDGRSCERCDEYRPTVDRILIIKLGSLGDVLRTTCILPAIYRTYTAPQVTWVTRRAALPLLVHNPLISRVLAVEEPYLERLLVERFTAGFCLDSDAQSAGILTLSRCRRQFGFRLDERGRVLPASLESTDWWLMGIDDRRRRANRRTLQAIMYETCAIPEPISRPMLWIPDPSWTRAESILAAAGLPDGRPVVGLNTGGGSRRQHKKWTTAGWISLVEQLQSGPEPPALLLLGGPGERDLNASLAARFGSSVVSAGCDQDLLTFAALVGSVDVLVTSDSLALHIATALARPAVALVGPTSARELELYGLGEVLSGDVDCRCCYRSNCDRRPTCMDLLSAGRVAEAVRRWRGVAVQGAGCSVQGSGFKVQGSRFG
jgi:heptosyltransferase-2